MPETIDQMVPEVRIHCKACQDRDVSATLREETWRLQPFGIVLGREYYVKCSKCGKEMMIVGLKPDNLRDRTADELDEYLVGPASTKGAVLATIAVVACWVPLLGFWLSLKSYRMNRRSHGLPKLASLAALIVSTPFAFAGLAAVVIIPIMILAALSE